MHMVRHQAICPDLHAGLPRVHRQQVAIDVLIAVFEKDGLPPVTSLGHVLRNAGNNNSCETSHYLLPVAAHKLMAGARGSVFDMSECLSELEGIIAHVPVTQWPDGYYASYGFDSMDRVAWVAASGSTLASYTYDPYSRRTNLAYLNGASIAYTYSPGSDLLTLTDGFVTTTKNAVYTLGYTNAHQLQSEEVSNPATYDFGPPNTTGTTSYAAVNALNQYPSVTPMGGSSPPNSGTNCQGSAQAMSYDCNGNLTFDGVNTYSYDPKNRLMNVATGSTQIASYAYDPFGRRETKTAGATITNFLNDGEDEIAEYDGSGNVLRRFVPGPAINEPVAYEDCSGATRPKCTGTGPAISYYHTDHHGSVVAMSDPTSGNPITGTTFSYDPFGNPSAPLSGQPFHYVGMYYDAETGLYYDRARYYSPTLGRFMQTLPCRR
jgi:YD repeat-containing protein